MFWKLWELLIIFHMSKCIAIHSLSLPQVSQHALFRAGKPSKAHHTHTTFKENMNKKTYKRNKFLLTA